MAKVIAGTKIPESKIAREATELATSWYAHFQCFRHS
jgi:hypothetical protein